MADLTMCTQTLCPNAGHCLRAQATPGERQSMAAFPYTLGADGVICEHYIPTGCVTFSTTTAQKDEHDG